MNILIAPNAFKNSLSADEVAAAIKEGFMMSRLDCQCECFAVGDGGDGTAALIIDKCHGTLQQTQVQDPLGRSIIASYGLIDAGKTAVIEMANASGLRLLKQNELNPLGASSFGTGQQISDALDKGAEKIIIGMGGSATVDGATGMLRALGMRFLDAQDKELLQLPEELVQLAKIDLLGLDTRIQKTSFVVLCDVDNLLLGSNGAAAMFGPQKGATAAGVKQLDAALAKLAEMTLAQTGKDMASVKYGGTAGGAAAGLFAFLDAKLENGIDYFLTLTGFDEALAHASLVVTGEGSIDEQTLQGKGPFGVAKRAKEKQLPVVGLAGAVPLNNHPKLQAYFDVLLPISHQLLDLPAALAASRQNLVRTALALGNTLAAGKTIK